MKILLIKVIIIKNNYHLISPDLDLDPINVFEIIDLEYKKKQQKAKFKKSHRK